MNDLHAAAQALIDRIHDEGSSPLDWPEFKALTAALSEPKKEVRRVRALTETVTKGK
jgi:hypothetical protein